MRERRVTILTGHYGSGKTNIAVNYALYLRALGRRVTVADLDIVNPYFRTADSRETLAAAGVELIASGFANSNLDVPALPKELYPAVLNRAQSAVLDVGGDDRGAVALGRFVPDIRAEGDYEMLFTANFFRPLTTTAEAALAVLREIEAACGLACTGLVNNTNLGAATTARDVLDSVERMRALSAASGLPVLMTAAQRRLCGELKGEIPDLFGLDLQKRITDA